MTVLSRSRPGPPVVAPPPLPGRVGSLLARLGDRALGIASVLVLALLVGLAVGAYAKVFSPVVTVTLRTDRAGNQMSALADVKIRGVRVGEVRSVTSTGDGAVLELALDPDQVGLLPRDVEARLLPKTLFGEKYVALSPGTTGTSEVLQDGDVIDQDRSATALELEQVLDDLLPLLQAVRPQDLALTLNALATALEGRGESIGESLSTLDDYLTEINPLLPTIQQDIAAIADVADLYADVTPDLARILRSLSTTSATLVERQQQLQSFLVGTAGLARTADGVLTENETRIIRLGQVSAPVLGVLADYSPIYPCVAQGLTEFDPLISDAFSRNGLSITLRVVPQRPAYQPGEEPAFDDTRAPDCFGVPDPSVPFPGVTFRDGSAGPDAYLFSRLPSALVGPTSGLAGTAEEQAVVGALVSPRLGVAADDVPDVATLLVGPMARGTEVDVS